MTRAGGLAVLALLAAAGNAAAAAPVGVVDFEGGRAGAVARLSERTLAPTSRPVPLHGYAWGAAVAGDRVAVGPAAAAKGEDESVRAATWPPNGLIAVTGYDARGRTSTPFGLRLLAPRTGTLRGGRRAAGDGAATHPSGEVGAAAGSG